MSIMVDHLCKECQRSLYVPIKFNITESDVSLVSSQHPDWNINKHNLGRICCPYCGTINFITVEEHND